MNNVITRKVTVGTSYAPLVANSLIGSVVISAPLTNSGVVYIRSDDDAVDVPWQPGESFPFVSVDLATIQAKGTAGDLLTINGGTW